MHFNRLNLATETILRGCWDLVLKTIILVTLKPEEKREPLNPRLKYINCKHHETLI